MYFLLSNQSWAHNPIFREVQGRRRGYTNFSTKIFLEKHRRYCPCFLLTPLNSYKRGTAKKSREKKSKVQKQSQTQLWFFLQGWNGEAQQEAATVKPKLGYDRPCVFSLGMNWSPLSSGIAGVSHIHYKQGWLDLLRWWTQKQLCAPARRALTSMPLITELPTDIPKQGKEIWMQFMLQCYSRDPAQRLKVCRTWELTSVKHLLR